MVTITGTINTDYEIVTNDGQVYQIVENLKGKEVVELIDRKVRITGTVRKEGEASKIRVASYEVLD
jgi:transcription antitermination factor NusA-like protein